ncbi:MAG: cofactor-independent phosphoglycerate mutase [Candidatus Omnitrophica bacterium CG07_land_8_20_14_0_80_50_8]|nr:MAG: cofactor-independent phosphoglycerate mutase [Candidatus Omnitrophica bacterium CG07_land_8_20_14_0_80_50_8]
MKYIVVILDGMGDEPVGSLGGQTPLEAAATPEMDYYSSHGMAGLSCNIPKGFTPGTDIGCMSIFGYDPAVYFTGRGPLEAAEHGIKLEANEIAFRCNLVTLEGDLLEDFSADHISLGEARNLLESLNEKLTAKGPAKICFYPGHGTGYRNLMVCQDPAHDMDRIVCTPPHDVMGQAYQNFFPKGPEAKFLIDLMEESRELFKNHPVNKKRLLDGKGQASMIWCWGQGHSPAFPSYFKRYGFHGAVITAVDLVKGIAIHAGLDVIRVPGVTGYFDTNYIGKAEYAVNALRSRDFVIVHIESPDEAGHIGNLKLKIKAIEDVDRLVIGTLRKSLSEFKDYRLMIVSDHQTCVESRTHAAGPVPFLIYDRRKEQKGPKKFSEKTAGLSGRFIEKGYELMDAFIKEGTK